MILILQPNVHTFLILRLGVLFSDVTSSLCSRVRVTAGDGKGTGEPQLCSARERQPRRASGLDCSGLHALTSLLASRGRVPHPPPQSRVQFWGGNRYPSQGCSANSCPCLPSVLRPFSIPKSGTTEQLHFTAFPNPGSLFLKLLPTGLASIHVYWNQAAREEYVCATPNFS